VKEAINKLNTRHLCQVMKTVIEKRSKYAEVLPLIKNRDIIEIDVTLGRLLSHLSFRRWVVQGLYLQPNPEFQRFWFGLIARGDRRPIDLVERREIWTKWFGTSKRTQYPLCIGSRGSEGSTIYDPDERKGTFHLGHIRPFAAPHYGPCEQWNLVPICTACNSIGICSNLWLQSMFLGDVDVEV
jgi:hypothetical protein